MGHPAGWAEKGQWPGCFKEGQRYVGHSYRLDGSRRYFRCRPASRPTSRPNGWSLILPPPTYRRYRKALYVQYTDASFSTRSPQPAHMGLLGPMMVLEPGDTLVVVLQNHLPFDINLDPEGGLVALPGGAAGGGQAVGPGESYTYRWVVPTEVRAHH